LLLNRLPRRLLQILAVVLGTAFAVPALAHPHVWVTAKAEVVFNGNGEITGIRHIWQFDKDFTAYATLNLDTNNDGKLSAEELRPLADTNIDALKDYDYFTLVYVGTKRIPVAKPTEYWLDFRGGRLTLFYTLPLAKPLKASGDIMIEVGDPEYFVAISFVKGKEVTLDGDAKGCLASFTPPHALDTQTMTMLGSIPASQHDLPPELVKVASLLSNVINIRCPKGDGELPVAGAPANATDAVDQLAGGGAPAGTLTAGDRAAAPQAQPAAPPPAPVPAAALPKVVILDQNGQALPPQPDVPAQTATAPPAPATGGLWGWLGGLFGGGK